MEDEKKTKGKLIEELKELRQSVATLKGFEEQFKQAKVDQEKFTKAFLQNSIPIGITTLKEGRFVEISDTYLDLMGRKRDEVVGHTSREIGFITEEQRVSFFHELNKSGRIENFEMEVKTKGGEMRQGLFNSVLLTLGNEQYLLTVMTDITLRKLAEKELEQSEANFRLITENSLDCIALIDTSGTYQYVTPSYKKILGYDAEDLIGNTGFSITHPDHLERVTRLCMETIEKNRHETKFETMTRHKDGHYVPMDVRMRTLYDSQGEIIGFVGAGRDITDRKLAEKALRDSEEKFRLLFNSGKDFMAVHLTGKDGMPTKFVQVNDATLELLGYTREEMLKLSPQDIDSAGSSGLVPAIIEKLIKDKHVLFETEVIAKSGQRIPVEVSLTSFQLQDSEATLCVARDITARKLAEEVLAKSQEKYRMITENITDCIFLVDKDNIIKHVTRSQEMLGYSPEELIGTSGSRLVHPDDSARIANLYQEGITLVWLENSYEVRLLHKDGRYVLIDMRVRLLTDAQKEFMAGVFVARDITQLRKIAHEQLPASKFYINRRLSPREKEILGWVMQGKSTWDISTILKISERTVKFHIDNAMKKLSALNRAHAVAIAMENELIGK